MKLPVDDKGRLRHHVWPGGYQILYVTKKNAVLCPECAQKEVDEPDEILEDPVVDAFIHYEGSSVFCDQCGKEFESEYGDPNEEDDDHN